MKLILHDLEETEFRRLFPYLGEDCKVVGEREEIRPCVGCFGCWIKTPCHCVIRDGYGDFGPVLSGCSDYILISRVIYGGLSPFVKNVLDRNIGYILPFFTVRNGEMHHAVRYREQIRLTVLGYGADVTEDERQTLRSLAAANALNLNAREPRVLFAESPEGLTKYREVLA